MLKSTLVQTAQIYSSKVLNYVDTTLSEGKIARNNKRGAGGHQAAHYRHSCSFDRLAGRLQPRLRRDLQAQISRFPDRPMSLDALPLLTCMTRSVLGIMRP